MILFETTDDDGTEWEVIIECDVEYCLPWTVHPTDEMFEYDPNLHWQRFAAAWEKGETDAEVLLF